MANVRGSVLKL